MRKNLLLCIVVFAVAFAVYAATSPRTLVSCGDSAELVTASYTLGVPHAPGYPTYTILGKLFSLIPAGKIAYRYAIFTAFFNSLILVNTFLILLLITKKRAFSLLGAWILAFSYHHWLYSHIPEVTALNTFFISLLCLVFLRWVRLDFRSNSPLAALFFFIFGLSVTHHYTAVLLIPGFMYYIFSANRESRLALTKKQVLFMALSFSVGLLPYLYLPLRAQSLPFINVGNINNVSRFLAHLMRKGSAMALSSYYTQFTARISLDLLRFYLESLVKSFTWFGVILGAGGFYALYRKERPLAIFIVCSFLFLGPVFYVLTRISPASVTLKAFLERFFAPSFFIFSIGIACGFLALHEIAGSYIKQPSFLQKSASTAVVILMTALSFTLFAKNYRELNLRDFRLCEVYGLDLMKSFEENSIVIVNGDNSLFTLWYLQKAEGQRPDLKILNANFGDWYCEQLPTHFPDLVIPRGICGSEFAREFIRRNYPRHKIYEVGIYGGEFGDCGIAGNPFVLQPKGLAMQIVERFDVREDDQRIWDSFDFNPPSRLPAGKAGNSPPVGVGMLAQKGLSLARGGDSEVNSARLSAKPRASARFSLRRSEKKESTGVSPWSFKKDRYAGPQGPYFAREIVYLYALAHYNKGVIYRQNGLPQIASQETEKAYNIDPTLADLFRN